MNFLIWIISYMAMILMTILEKKASIYSKKAYLHGEGENITYVGLSNLY